MPSPAKMQKDDQDIQLVNVDSKLKLKSWFYRQTDFGMITKHAMKGYGFNWSVDMIAAHHYIDEKIAIRISNLKNDEADQWFCQAKIHIEIDHPEESKKIVHTIAHRFHSGDSSLTVNLFPKNHFYAENGEWAAGDCRVTCAIMVDSVKGDSFFKKIITDWTEEMPGADSCIVVQGEKFFVGKMLLCMHAPYFETLFFGSFKEADMDTIELNDVDKDHFRLFLNYIHMFGVEMDVATVWPLLELGHYFDVNAIMAAAEIYLMKTHQITLSEKFVMADKYQMLVLKDQCMKELNSLEELNRLVCSEYYAELSEDSQTAISNMLNEMAEKNSLQNSFAPPHQQPSSSWNNVNQYPNPFTMPVQRPPQYPPPMYNPHNFLYTNQGASTSAAPNYGMGMGYQNPSMAPFPRQPPGPSMAGPLHFAPPPGFAAPPPAKRVRKARARPAPPALANQSSS